MSKNPARGHKVENTIRKERTYDVLSLQRESGNGTRNTRKKRHLQKIETRVATGAPAFEGRLNEGLRLQRKHRDKNEAKQSKTNVTPEKKNVMASANRTSGGYQFAPLVASQQGRANQHEPDCFGLSSSWPFPSRSGIPMRAVAQP